MLLIACALSYVPRASSNKHPPCEIKKEHQCIRFRAFVLRACVGVHVCMCVRARVCVCARAV